jgi:hypothetical protein
MQQGKVFYCETIKRNSEVDFAMDAKVLKPPQFGDPPWARHTLNGIGWVLFAPHYRRSLQVREQANCNIFYLFVSYILREFTTWQALHYSLGFRTLRGMTRGHHVTPSVTSNSRRFFPTSMKRPSRLLPLYISATSQRFDGIDNIHIIVNSLTLHATIFANTQHTSKDNKRLPNACILLWFL